MTALTFAWTACPTSCSSTSSNTLMLSSSSRQSPRFSPSSRAPSVACIHILLKVCNLFHELASDETTWRVRVAKRFPGRDPVFTFTLIYVVGSLSPPKYQVSILPFRRPRTFVGRWHVPVERMKRGCGGAARRGRPRGSPSTAPLPTMQL